jgi:hypothetical protein
MQGTGGAITAPAVDSSGNIYVGFNVKGGTTFAPGIMKIDNSGNLVWAKQHSISGGGGNYGFTPSLKVDSSGNVYGISLASISSTNYAYVIKYDTNGAVLWQKYISTAATLTSSVLDSSGNLYIAGGGTKALVIKLDPSGSISWSKEYTNGSSSLTLNSGFFTGMTINSAGELYCSGYCTYNSGAPLYKNGKYMFASRINSNTGDVINKVGIDFGTAANVTANCRSYNIAVDLEGNVYATFGPINLYYGSSAGIIKFPANLSSKTFQYEYSSSGYDATTGLVTGAVMTYVLTNKDSITLIGLGYNNYSSAPTWGPLIYQLPNNGSYLASDRPFYPAVSDGKMLSAATTNFAIDATFTFTDAPVAISFTALPWTIGSVSPSTVSNPMTSLTTAQT